MTKQALRERVWRLLVARRVARFPFPIDDRIPNFIGAEAAAARAATLPEWHKARRLKCNPDAPQRPVRLRALRDGKIVFMAVPRLRAERCFIKLDPQRLRGRLAEASTIGGAAKLGEPVGPEALGTIDLVVAGSVAVNSNGRRLGKGGGYSDLEWALARALGVVTRANAGAHDGARAADRPPGDPRDGPRRARRSHRDARACHPAARAQREAAGHSLGGVDRDADRGDAGDRTALSIAVARTRASAPDRARARSRSRRRHTRTRRRSGGRACPAPCA